MTQPDSQIDLILRFIEALHADPLAAPPPGLDDPDIALARDLARTVPRSTLGSPQRQRIWQRALAQAIQQRLAQGATLAPSESHNLSRSQSNGHHARQETEVMVTQLTGSSAATQPIPRQGRQTRAHQRQLSQPRSRGIWITTLVAAISALVIGGLLLTGLGDSTPPATDPNMGAGIGVSDNANQQQNDDPSATPATPVLEALRDLPVQAGPGAEYQVLLMLEVGGKLDITGISEDGAWYQVLVPGGALGWITKSAALITVYGALDDLPVVVVPTPTLVPTVTIVPVLPSATPTATHTATPYLEVQAMTATAVNDYFNATATPIMRPTLSPEDFTGIYRHMWREYSAYTENIDSLWSQDGRYLVVANGDSVEIFEMGSSEVKIAAEHEGDITAMAINPMGTVLATGTTMGEARLYILPDAENWVVLATGCEEDCTITQVEFNPAGTYLMVQSKAESAQHVHVYALPEALYR